MFSQPFHHVRLNSVSTRKTLICVVCGSIARGYNFGAVTCMSCKMFFRRNALTTIEKLRVCQGGHGIINNQTRKHCSYCRLLKCFRMGMRKELIKGKVRCSKLNVHLKEQLQMWHFGCIRPLDLLQWSNCSSLSNNDWLLLYQLSSMFDSLTDNVISKAQEISHQVASIGIQPPKIRVKATYIYDIANVFTNVALEFIRSIPQFILLPSLNKQALLMRNIRPVLMFYAHYQLNLRHIQKLCQTSWWITALDCIFSPSVRDAHYEINYQIAQLAFVDPYLIKLILVLLAFSTNNIDHDESSITDHLDEYYHAFRLHKIQNTYANLTWKYLVHRFGEDHGGHLYCDIIKSILRVQTFVSVINNSTTPSERKFDQNTTRIIDRTRTLYREN